MKKNETAQMAVRNITYEESRASRNSGIMLLFPMFKVKFNLELIFRLDYKVTKQ